MTRVSLLLKHHDLTGASDLHQAAGEIQREAQALHGVRVLLLRSPRDGHKERDGETDCFERELRNRGQQTALVKPALTGDRSMN